MKKKVVMLVVGLVILTGCSGEATKKAQSTTSTEKVAKIQKSPTSTVKKDKETRTSTSTKSSADTATTATSATVAPAIWNAAKSAQLNAFIAKWELTMKQEYLEYPKGTPLRYQHMTLPDDIINKENRFTGFEYNFSLKNLQWFDGTVTYDDTYQLLTVYSDLTDTTVDLGHTYFFMLHNGQPEIAFGMLWQGLGDHQPFAFQSTKNAELTNAFTTIVTSSADTAATTSSEPTTSSVDTQNLTTTQFEDWIVKIGHAWEKTTQFAFLNKAEWNVAISTDSTGLLMADLRQNNEANTVNSHIIAFRLNGNGQLEQENSSRTKWYVVADTYGEVPIAQRFTE
jgi:hypothetical protein